MKLKMIALFIFSVATVFAQGNLFKGGKFETGNDVLSWQPGHWVHIGPALGDYKKLLPIMSPFCQRQLVLDAKSGRWSIKVATDKATHKIKDNKGGIILVSNSLNQTVNVAPGKYKMSVWVKGKFEKLPGYNALRLFISCTKKDKKVVSLLDHQFKITNSWVLFEKELNVPANGSALVFRFALYGVGEIQLDDATLVKIN